MTQQTILDVDWVVLEDAPVMAELAPPVDADAPMPPNADTDDAPAIRIRPWAKPLLHGALALAGLWLAGLAFIILDGALFAEATIRGGYGFAGMPICVLIAVAFVADPDYERRTEETYWTWGGYPVGPCTPSRNTLTGREER